MILKDLSVFKFGNNIEKHDGATRICERANPEIIDINYGCPVKKRK